MTHRPHGPTLVILIKHKNHGPIKVPEMDSSDGHITLLTHLMPLNVTFKTAIIVHFM